MFQRHALHIKDSVLSPYVTCIALIVRYHNCTPILRCRVGIFALHLRALFLRALRLRTHTLNTISLCTQWVNITTENLQLFKLV